MKELHIDGMNCDHCRKSVLEAVSTLAGVTNPQVDLQKKVLTWEESSPVNVEAVKTAVRNAGYEPK